MGAIMGYRDYKGRILRLTLAPLLYTRYSKPTLTNQGAASQRKSGWAPGPVSGRPDLFPGHGFTIHRGALTLKTGVLAYIILYKYSYISILRNPQNSLGRYLDPYITLERRAKA